MPETSGSQTQGYRDVKYKKTQKGNPHQLTVMQHCFPKKSIDRFANDQGVVCVHILKTSKTITLRPDDPIFCARRTWDERAESGFMKEIEDTYQDFADRVAAGKVVRRLSDIERKIVTDMFALWNIRCLWKNKPLDDTKIVGALGTRHNLSLDDQELLEKNHITAIRPDASMDGRHFTGIQIQRNIFHVREVMNDAHWGILKSRCGEFVVPDSCDNRVLLPLTPNLCFANIIGYRIVDSADLAKMNAQSMLTSKEYYFARNL